MMEYELHTTIPGAAPSKNNKLSFKLTRDAAESQYNMKIVTGFQRTLIVTKIGLHILRLALKNYRSFKTSSRVIKEILLLKSAVFGGFKTKLITLDDKIYHSIYTPGYPSKLFDDYILAEFNRVKPIKLKTNNLNFILFAMTSKCPLRCEHCLEWDNLNTKETFSLPQLQEIVAKFQKDGISQIHCSGGEPMLRVKELVQLISGAASQSEFYVLTSGYNFTANNARALKEAGLTGVVISLDHFDGEMHNAFRGFNNSFENVLSAIQNAQKQNLLITLTLCATKTFVTRDNLMKYAELAKNLKVAFIQILEPKAVGHYKDKDVFLNEEQFKILEEFCLELNFSPKYNAYPVLLYHGYYQRRIGCLSGGKKNLYIDSKGNVNACPFCHTHHFNIKDLLGTNTSIKNSLIKPGCSQYGNS